MSVASPSPRRRMRFADAELGSAGARRDAVAQEMDDSAPDDFRRAGHARRRPGHHAAILCRSRASSSRDATTSICAPTPIRIITDRGVVDQEAVTSQAQIILSRDLAREVIEKLKLGELPEFDPTLNGVSPIKAVLGLFGLAKDPLSMTPEERVLQAYYDRPQRVTRSRNRASSISIFSPRIPSSPRGSPTPSPTVIWCGSAKPSRSRRKRRGQWLSGEIETMRKKVGAGRGQGRGLPRQDQSSGRHQQHHAVGADSSATSMPSSPRRARRRPTPRPRPR